MNSKKKGNRNERKTAKLFETWTGYPFERVPSSGGLRWAKKSDTVGDIICTDEHHSRYFTFSIECKSHAEIDFSELLLPNKGVKVLEFWEQAAEDAKRANRIPILLMRYNMMPSNYYFVAMEGNYAQFLLQALQFNPKRLEFVKDNTWLWLFPSPELFSTDYKLVHKFNKGYIKQNGNN